jgi:hypothetical protein
MRIWKSLAKPVRVALILFLGIAALVPLGEMFDAALSALSDRIPDPLCQALRWVDRAWLPVDMLLVPLLGLAVAVYLLWSNARRRSSSLADLVADTRQLGQWIVVALLGNGTSDVLLRAWTSGEGSSNALGDVLILALGLRDIGATVALVSAVLLAFGLLGIGLLRKSTALLLLVVAIGAIVALEAFRAHSSMDLIFPLLVYLVAQHVIGRRLVEDARANANA